MKISQLRKKPKGELPTILRENQDKLRQLRFDLSAGKIKNVKEVQKVRKEIAQILTLLHKG